MVLIFSAAANFIAGLKLNSRRLTDCLERKINQNHDKPKREYEKYLACRNAVLSAGGAVGFTGK